MSITLPKIFGHRGFRENGIYENSPEAFLAAAKYAQGLETDAVISKEGKVFFVHDTDLANNVTIYELERHLTPESVAMIGERRMDQMTIAEISALRLHNGQKIPDFPVLAEAMKINRDFIANVELKQKDTALPVLKTINECLRNGVLEKDRFLISSFSFPELLAARRSGTDLDLGLILESSQVTATRMYPYRDDNDSFYIPFSRENLNGPQAREIKPVFYSINEYDLTAENLKIMEESCPGAKVLIWWYRTEPAPALNTGFLKKFRQLVETGHVSSLFAIITNFPTAMQAELLKITG